jgi:hypothetical protein
MAQANAPDPMRGKQMNEKDRVAGKFTRAEFNAEVVQASKEALKRSRELLEITKARVRCSSGLHTEAAPLNDRLAKLRLLVNRPAVQVRIAAEAAAAAQEADRRGKVDLADLLWTFVRRTRVRAMSRRFLAKPRHQSGS